MKRFYFRITFLFFLLFLCKGTFAQMVGSDIFMQASHCEVGIGRLGAFGTFSAPPSGYHANVYQFGSIVLGFVADCDEDGWTVGTPPYFGDYFMPGDPVEGWAIQMGGTRNDAYYQNDGFYSYYGPGGTTLSGNTVSYSNVGGVMTGVWQGTAYTYMSITQTSVMDTANMYWVTTVTLKNTGSSTMNDIYYMRQLDPDNEEPETGDFTTTNTIDIQTKDSVLVSGIGTVYSPRSYLGLGTKNCGARVFIVSYSLLPDETIGLDDIYNESASGLLYSGNLTEDVGVGLVFHVCDLPPGDSTSLEYAYIVRAEDYDKALNATAPAILAAGKPFLDTTDTVTLCTTVKDTIPVNIKNGSDYSWVWTPSAGLSTTTGTSNEVYADISSGTVTYTITGTPLSCNTCSERTYLLTVIPGITNPPVTAPAIFCEGGAATALTAIGTGLLWYAADSGGTGSSIAPVPSTSSLGTSMYYVSQTIAGCESRRDSVPVYIVPPPSITASSNSPVCVGSVLLLTATDTVTIGTVTYSWGGPDLFSSTLKDVYDTVASVSATGSYTLTSYFGGCISASAIDVVVNPLPDITGDTFSNPYPCGATNGTITLKGLTAGSPYVVYYTDSVLGIDSAFAVANDSGNIVLTGFGAGAYSNFSVLSIAGCFSNVLPGPIRLTGPPLGVVTASNSSPVCADTSVLLSVSDTLSGTISYFWSGPDSFSSTLQNPLISSISALGAGTYSVVVGENGCISPVATTVVVVNPTPVITGLSSTNPTTCSGTDGTITLSGLSSSTSYTVHYSGTTSSKTTTITADSSGNVVITGLSAGTYSGISVKLGCPSNVVGPVTLSDPAIPVISGISNSGPVCAGASASLSCTAGTGVSYSWSGPASFVSTVSSPVISTTTSADSGLYTLTVSDSGCTSSPAYTDLIVYTQPAAPMPGSNSPVCADSTLLLTATDIVGGASYSWTGPDSFTSGLQNPALPDVSLSGGGTYTVTASYHGCVSSPATLTVVVDSVPVITSVNHTDPTSCSIGDGSISLGGLSAGVAYTVNYAKSGIDSSLSITANSSGEVVINGLSGGTYNNLSVAGVAGCPSNIVGPVILKNPATPVVTGISDSGPICAGDTLKLSCTASPGVTYSWTGPSGSAFTSALQSPVINTTTAADSGTYTLTVKDSGCTSSPLSTDVVVYKIPAIPVAGSNSPICSDSTLLLTAIGSTTGVSYSWAGPNFFVSGLQNPSLSGMLMAGNGVYSVTATVGGCSSLPGSVNVIVDSTPFIMVVTYSNPTTCSGSDGSITIGGLTSGATYSIDYKKDTSLFTTTLTASSSGEVVISSLSSATYNNIAASSGSCLSNTAGPVILHDPALPVITAISNSGPVCTGSGLKMSCTSETGATYSWTGPSFTSTLQNPVIAVTTLADTGLYSVTATDSGCTSLPKSTEVVIYAMPPTPLAVSNSPVCAGSELILSANDAMSGVTYIWSGPLGYDSTSASPVLSDATLANAGTYYLTASNHGCTSPADSTFVIINATPEIASYTYTNPTICLGSDGTITLNGPLAGTTYEVTYTLNGKPDSASLTANSSGQILLTGLSSGVYDKIQVSAGGCPSNIVGPLTLMDPAPPAVPAISNNSPVCAGSSLIFNSSDTTSGISYSWTGPGFAVPDTTSNPVINSVSPYASGVYTLTVTKYNCHTSNSIEALVNVTPPVPLAHSNSPVCAGSTLRLIANSTAGSVYNWQGPSGFSAITLDTMVVIEKAEASAIGMYMVWATLAGCPSPTDSTQVLVTPLPPAPSVSDTGYCQNDLTAVALVATGNDLLWYTSLYGGTGSTSVVPSTKISGELVWYVSQTVSGCEGPRAKQTVIILPQPAMPAVTPETLCQVTGGTTLAEAAGTGLLWYVPGDDTGSSATPLVHLDSVKNYTWNVTQTVNGCTSYPSTETVTVKETPGKPVANNDSICSKDLLQLNATDTTPNVTYLWSGPAGFISTLESPSIANVSPSESGAYMVTVTLNNCPSVVDTIQVIIYPMPIFNIVESKPYVCQYDTITLAYSGPSFTNGGTYTWYSSYGSYNPSGPVSVFNFSSPGTFPVTLKVFDNDIKQCPNTDTTEVSVMPAPTGIIYIKPALCVGEVADVSLLNIQGEVVNYKWNYAPAVAVSTPANPWDPQSLVWNDSGTYVITLTVKTNMQCPSALISDTVNIHPLPIATIGALSANMPVCENDSMLFSPADYVPGSQYRWSPAPFFNNTNAESTYGTIAFTGYITLNVTNEWGCAATDSVLVTTQSCCQLAMPNAFMPNSEKSGPNAFYRPVTTRTFMVHIFRIVNRWGQTVFETNNIANGWDGTFNGTPQDVGVYYYYLKYDCEGKTFEKSGDVTLVR